MAIQVRKEHYTSKKYDDFFRFISYQKQIELIIQSNPKSTLEIGVGNKTVSNYLKNNGLNLTTCDFDKNLNPDKVGDILKLPFKKNKFELLVCFEVLEHLPWESLDLALFKLNRVSSKKVIISVPYSCISFNFWTKFPLSNYLKKPFLALSLRIPKFYKRHKFDGEHHWELGKHNFSKNKFKKKVSKYFKIVSEEYSPLNPHHQFFILKKLK